MSRLAAILPLLLVLCAPDGTAAPRSIALEDGLARFLEGRELVFLVRDLEGQEAEALSPERLDERHPPFSTFKIPNFLIALDTGVVADARALQAWNPRRRPAESFWPESWKQAQSLVTAFRRSAVWFFRDIALEVGGAEYRRILQGFGYGNAVAADGSDAFWLDGSLRISPREQVEFLTRLLAGELEVSPAAFAALEAASLLDESGGCRLHGKTGAGPVGEDFDGPFEGWLVGWTRCPDRPDSVYALWTRGESFAAIAGFRRSATRRLLAGLGRYPEKEEDDMATAAHQHHAIDYIEIPVTDLVEAKRFYGEAFGWGFNDYGDQYVGIRRRADDPEAEAGGFRPVDTVTAGGVLVILYSADLEASLAAVRQAGGTITAEPFDFPGGRRFEFTDPFGHQLAVWSSR